MGGVSLSGMGLRIAGLSACPEGGRHEVSIEVVSAAKDQGRASGRCVKCKQLVQLERDG